MADRMSGFSCPLISSASDIVVQALDPHFPSAPLISVIIATRNRRHILARTLATVLAQDYPHEAFEVVLADDGSTDATVDWVRSLKKGRPLESLSPHPPVPN